MSDQETRSKNARFRLKLFGATLISAAMFVGVIRLYVWIGTPSPWLGYILTTCLFLVAFIIFLVDLMTISEADTRARTPYPRVKDLIMSLPFIGASISFAGSALTVIEWALEAAAAN